MIAPDCHRNFSILSQSLSVRSLVDGTDLPKRDTSIRIFHSGKSSIGVNLCVLFVLDVCELDYPPIIWQGEFVKDSADFPGIGSAPVAVNCQWLRASV
jgi:hypothetical protein